MRRLALFLGMVIGLPAAAQAQACLGSVSFATVPVRIGGGAIFGEDYTAYAASLIAGRDGSIFGDVGVARIYADGFDDTEDQLFADVGYQRSVGPRAQLCPVVGAGLGSGPDDDGFDVRSRFASAGLALGLTYRPAAGVRIIPNGTLRYQYAASDITDPSGVEETFSDTYGVGDIGLGLIFFGDRLAIQPRVQIPFGADDNSVSYGLSVSLGIGLRR
ncbi:MAG TPA: hypothetical protein VFZ21_18390 [Gemmatimonadaceae bacterium]|jgi:hypothetical protein|nr:hypothetical protein [Gemmatimonadaceae bacterium]